MQLAVRPPAAPAQVHCHGPLPGNGAGYRSAQARDRWFFAAGSDAQVRIIRRRAVAPCNHGAPPLLPSGRAHVAVAHLSGHPL